MPLKHLSLSIRLWRVIVIVAAVSTSILEPYCWLNEFEQQMQTLLHSLMPLLPLFVLFNRRPLGPLVLSVLERRFMKRVEFG